MREKTNTKNYTPISKCIFKDMMLENQFANPSGVLVYIYFRKYILIRFYIYIYIYIYKLYQKLEKNYVNVCNLIKMKMFIQPVFFPC